MASCEIIMMKMVMSITSMRAMVMVMMTNTLILVNLVLYLSRFFYICQWWWLMNIFILVDLFLHLSRFLYLQRIFLIFLRSHCDVPVHLLFSTRPCLIWGWGRRGPWACCCWPSSPPSCSGCPGPSQNSNGVNPSALCVTLLASCRSDPFKGLVHAATACSMAHQPVPWGVLLRSARIKVHCVEVTESSSVFYQHSNFSNCI